MDYELWKYVVEYDNSCGECRIDTIMKRTRRHIIYNVAMGFTKPGKLDYTDKNNKLHIIRCIYNNGSWSYSEKIK